MPESLLARTSLVEVNQGGERVSSRGSVGRVCPCLAEDLSCLDGFMAGARAQPYVVGRGWSRASQPLNPVSLDLRGEGLTVSRLLH